jgi:hypothetical protein
MKVVMMVDWMVAWMVLSKVERMDAKMVVSTAVSLAN